MVINSSKPPLGVLLPLSLPPLCLHAQRKQRQVLKHWDRFRVRGGHFQTPVLLRQPVPSGVAGVSCVRLPSTWNAVSSFFFLRFYLFLHERHTERQRHRQREKQAPCREPDVGLDPGTPGSCPGPTAGTKPLSHPGIPEMQLVRMKMCRKCKRYSGFWSLRAVTKKCEISHQ